MIRQRGKETCPAPGGDNGQRHRSGSAGDVATDASNIPAKRARGGAMGSHGLQQASPPTFTTGLRDCAVVAGRSVNLRVALQGNPRPTLSWLKDGVTLRDPWPDEDTCLRVRGEGLYTCVAVNSAGDARTSARIVMSTGPGPGPRDSSQDSSPKRTTRTREKASATSVETKAMTKWTEGREPVGLENAAPKGSGNRNALRISMDNGTAPDSLISPVQVSSVRDESAAASPENPSITVAAVGPKAPVKVKRVVHKPPRSPVRGLLSAEKEEDEEPPGASKLDSLGHSPSQEKLKIPEWQRSALSSTFKERCKMFERKIEQTTREKKESLQKPKQSPPTLTIRNRSHSLDKLSALKIKQEDEEVQASGKRKQDRLASFRGKVKSASLEEKVEKDDFDAQETRQKAPDDEPNQKDTLAPKVPPNENRNLRSKSPIEMSTTLSNKQAITGNNENVTDRCSDNLPEMAQPTRSLAPTTKPHSQYCPSPNIPAEQKPTDGVALPCQPPSKKPSSTLVVESGMEVTSKEMQCERDEKKMESAARRKNKPLEGKALPRGKRNIVESNKGSLKTAQKSTDQTDIKRSLVETPKLIICEEPAAEDESDTSKLQAHKEEEGVESLQRATRHPDEQVSSDVDASHISKSAESNDLYQPVRKKCMMDPAFRTSGTMTNKSEASATVSLETDLEAMDAENSSTPQDCLAKMEIESTEVNSPQALNQETGDQEIDVGRPQLTKCSGDIAKHHELAQKSVTTKDERHTIKQTISDIEVQRKSGKSSETAEDQKFMLTPDGMEGPDAFEASKESYKRSSVKQRCKERKRRKTTVLATGSDVSGNEKEDELGGEQSDEWSTSEEDDILTTPVFEQPLDDITVNTGSPATFICIISGHPAPEVHWKKDKMAVESSGPCLLGSEGGRHWLSIPVAASSDGGIYSVTASNEVGVTGCSAMLTICPGENSDYMEVSSNEKHVYPVEKEEANAVNEENLSPADDKPITVSSLEAATVVRVQDPIITEQLATPIGESGHPPIFKDSMEDQVVLLGENALFRITIFGEPTPVVIWRRDDALVLEDERHQAGFGAEDSVAWLIVLAAEAEDDGVYGCTASNRHGTQEAHACLEVKVPSVPEKADLAFAEPLRPVTVQAGQSARLECVVITPPDAELDWLRDWRLLQPALLSCKMHFDGRRCVLDLASLHEDDSGIYACKLSTAHDEVTSSAQLTVLPSETPLFTKRLEELEVVEGRPARFDCKISGNPAPTVNWYHFGRPVQDSERLRVLHDRGLHSLVIGRVCSEDEGEYLVVARNGLGEVRCSAELYVEEPRATLVSPMTKLEKMPSIPEEPEGPDPETETLTLPDFIQTIRDVEVLEGGQAKLHCQVCGSPRPTVTWCHHGLRLEPGGNIAMTQQKDTFCLIIKLAKRSDGGVYKCVISNKVGKSSAYAHVYIIDQPLDPPENVHVQNATSRTITLSWKEPKKIHSFIDPSSVTYTVQNQVRGVNNWSDLATGLLAITYTVQNLIPGLEYSFRVITSSGNFCSKPSKPTSLFCLPQKEPFLEEKPCFLERPDNLYVAENSSVRIVYTLNHVNASLAWTRDNHPVVLHSDGYSLHMDDGDGEGDRVTLEVARVTRNHIGMYTCRVQNCHGQSSCDVGLYLAEPPHFEDIMEDVEAVCGQTARFTVVVEGRPLPDVLWFKDDELLAESNHLSFVYEDSECSLVLLNVTESDCGVYTCTARNIAGECSCKADLSLHTEREEVTDEELLRRMRRVLDFFDVKEEIGRGAFSVVKRVVERATGAQFSAKFVSCGAQHKAEARRELQILSQLDYKQILSIHDAFETKSRLILITELCFTEELLDRLVKKHCIRELEVQGFVQQLLEGLNFLHHNNIMHLDIKPGNILMKSNDNDDIKICDFGFAQEWVPEKEQYSLFGTPEFIAPEIVSQRPVSPSADLWSVGVITYICLSGTSPFAGENDRASLLRVQQGKFTFDRCFHHLSDQAMEFISSLLVMEPSKRPSALESFDHNWFKLGHSAAWRRNSITTNRLKFFLSRRKWQRSLIAHGSKLVMRSVAQLKAAPVGQQSLGVPRRLADPAGASSSSDSDDADDLAALALSLRTADSTSKPQTPTPPLGQHSEEVEHREIVGSLKKEGFKQDATHLVSGGSDESMGRELNVESSLLGSGRGHRKRLSPRGCSADSEPPCSSSDDDITMATHQHSDSSWQKRRSQLRRGSSADSALPPETDELRGTMEGAKAVLRSTASLDSPGATSIVAAHSEEGLRRKQVPAGEGGGDEHSLRLALVRQQLLRTSSAEKLSGLRGPLLEHLGIGGEDQNGLASSGGSRTEMLASRKLHAGCESSGRAKIGLMQTSQSLDQPSLHSKSRMQKSSSFTLAEEVPSHRRLAGVPLEIPNKQSYRDNKKEPSSLAAALRELAEPLVKQEAHVDAIPHKNSHAEMKLKGGVKVLAGNCKSAAETKFQETPAQGKNISSDHVLNAAVHSKESATHSIDSSTFLKPVVTPILSSEQVSAPDSTKVKIPSSFAENKESQPCVSQAVQLGVEANTPKLGASQPLRPCRSTVAGTVKLSSEVRPQEMLLVKRPLGPTVTPEGICENEREVNAGYLKAQKEQSDTKSTREGLKPGKPSAAERREHRQLVPKVPSVDTALPPDNAQPPSTILQAKPMPEFPTIRKSASVSRIQNRSDAKLRNFGASRESGASVETDSLGSTDLGSEASAPAAVGRNLPYRRGSGTVSLPGEVKDWKTSLPKLRHRTPSEERILRIVDIDSEEIFEAKFKKKRESSLSRNLGITRRMRSEEHIESLNHDKEEVIYRPRQQGTPVEMMLDEAGDKELKESHSDTTAVEGKLSRKSSATSLASEVSQGPEKEMTLTRRLSARFKRTPLQDSKVNVDVTKKEQTDNVGKKVPFLRRASKDDRIKKEQDVEEGNGGCNLRKESSSLSQGIKKRIESLSMALSRSSSEDRSGREAGRTMKSKFGAKGAPGMIKRASSEIFINKKAAGPEPTSKRLLKAAPLAASTECLGSGPLARAEPEKRSIWNRWEIGRGKKAKEPLGTSSSSNNQEKTATSEPSTQTTAGVKPKFNLELKDEVIVEGQPFTLHCLPEGNSLLSIRWFKDKKPLSSDGHIKTSSGADGRHILTALKATKKDVGTYECVASNSVGTESSSCRVCLAQLPGRPKQPEVPRVCKEGALVVWKAAECQGHVTYTLEAKKLGVDSWAVVAADLEDPYHNVTRLTPGGIYKFRVSCVNKAGQGQASLSSSKVTIPGTDVVPGADGSDGGKTVSSTDQASGPQQGPVQKPYTFLEERARGRFGVIRECRENSTGKVFTAKVVLYTPEGKMAALREYEVLKALRHPAILALHEAYVTPQYLVLITERCPGKELLYKLIEIPRYTEEDVVTYVVEVFEALNYLHEQRVLHLDIRSENIIISDKRHVKLIDFGSAHFYDPNDLQPLPSSTTLLECMAPEMITAGPVGPAADTWAVGVLTFTLLSGDSPFLGSSNKQTEENIRRFRVDFEKCYINSSPESKMFLKSLLSPVPQERPSTKACLKLPWLQETDVSHLRRASHSFPTWKLQQYLQGATRHRLESATRHRVLLRSSSTLK